MDDAEKEACELLYEYDRRMERGHNATSQASAKVHFESADKIRADIIKAIARAPVVPEGFALVPVVPTEEMLVLFYETYLSKKRHHEDDDGEDWWAAMLAAAPKVTP